MRWVEQGILPAPQEDRGRQFYQSLGYLKFHTHWGTSLITKLPYNNYMKLVLYFNPICCLLKTMKFNKFVISFII